MFAPKVTKASASPTNKRLPQRSTLVARPFGGAGVEQAHMLQRRIGNQATLRLLAQRTSSLTGNQPAGDYDQEADRENVTAQEATGRVAWDFSKIPIFLPDRENRPQAPSPLNLTSLSSNMQRKLAVGRADDPLEHEADRAADQVMRMPDPQPTSSAAITRLDRKCSGCAAEEEETLSAKRIGSDADRADAPAPPIVHEVLRSPGRPLDASARAFFEPRFGCNFGQVRIHDDAHAADSSRAVRAVAYTVDDHIVFGTGQYAPRSIQGKELLAHELAHVLQQHDSDRGMTWTFPHLGSASEQQAEATPSVDDEPSPSDNFRRVGSAGAMVRRQDDGGGDQESGTPTITVPETTVVATPPASLRSWIGTTDYYVGRASDFALRNPGEIPPDYYFGYGNKYVHRFTAELRPSLSAAGKAWLDCTLVALQTAIEKRRDANVWAFAELERDNDKFQDFAYGTHTDAYISCGICDLSIVDETKIALTPDLKDLLGTRGLGQILDTLFGCTPDWYYPRGPAVGEIGVVNDPSERSAVSVAEPLRKAAPQTEPPERMLQAQASPSNTPGMATPTSAAPQDQIAQADSLRRTILRNAWVSVRQLQIACDEQADPTLLTQALSDQVRSFYDWLGILCSDPAFCREVALVLSDIDKNLNMTFPPPYFPTPQEMADPSEPCNLRSQFVAANYEDTQVRICPRLLTSQFTDVGRALTLTHELFHEPSFGMIHATFDVMNTSHCGLGATEEAVANPYCVTNVIGDLGAGEVL